VSFRVRFREVLRFMEVTAKLNNLRISPRKVRLVANLIKGMEVNGAKAQLRFLAKKSSQPLGKLLDSAVANAKNNFSLEENNLYISKIFVDSGQTLKRWLPRAFGRATPLMKRTSRVTLILAEKIPGVKKAKKAKKKKEKQNIAKEESLREETRERVAEEKPEESKKAKTKAVIKPYDVSGKSKKRFFSRQGVKKMFQRKSI